MDCDPPVPLTPSPEQCHPPAASPYIHTAVRGWLLRRVGGAALPEATPTLLIWRLSWLNGPRWAGQLLPLQLRPLVTPQTASLVTHRMREGANREVLGIIVSYKVKVKLVVSRGG